MPGARVNEQHTKTTLNFQIGEVSSLKAFTEEAKGKARGPVKTRSEREKSQIVKQNYWWKRARERGGTRFCSAQHTARSVRQKSAESQCWLASEHSKRANTLLPSSVFEAYHQHSLSVLTNGSGCGPCAFCG